MAQPLTVKVAVRVRWQWKALKKLLSLLTRVRLISLETSVNILNRYIDKGVIYRVDNAPWKSLGRKLSLE